jgi:hypothetical protein
VTLGAAARSGSTSPPPSAHAACFPRAEIKRDTGYYPDTPLSLNHSLMKGQPLRADPKVADALPDPPVAFGQKKFGTLAAMGIKKVTPPVDEKPPSIF